jgi:hypothetical protein
LIGLLFNPGTGTLQTHDLPAKRPKIIQNNSKKIKSRRDELRKDVLGLSHPKLASKLQGLLPAGTDLKTAADGFKNFGQFVAAVHVSQNLGIPFDQLKAKMTGPNPESLGKAISDLSPNADAKLEQKKAEKQAKDDEKS